MRINHRSPISLIHRSRRRNRGLKIVRSLAQKVYLLAPTAAIIALANLAVYAQSAGTQPSAQNPPTQNPAQSTSGQNPSAQNHPTQNHTAQPTSAQNIETTNSTLGEVDKYVTPLRAS